MHFQQPGLAFANFTIRVAKAGSAIAQGFDLGAQQHKTGLPRIENLELVPGLAILGDDFDPWGIRLACHLFSPVQRRLIFRCQNIPLQGVPANDAFP